MLRIRKSSIVIMTLLLGLLIPMAVHPVLASTESALRDLDAIWGAVWDEYADPFFNGVDWHRLPDEIRPIIQNAKTSQEAYAALADMVGRLGDPSTFLVEPDPYYSFYETEYAGIGVLIGIADTLNVLVPEPMFSEEEVAVLEVFQGTPAEAAGLLVGDVIVAVGDWQTTGASIDEISSRIRGPVGTEVDLTIRTPEGELRTVTITRQRVDLRPTVTFERYDDDVAYLRIETLLADQVSVAREYIAANADVEHLILDLRGVATGEPLATSELASWFLGNVNLGAFESRYDRYKLQAPPIAEDRRIRFDNELTVLINGGTSGLGEIVALLLSEYDRATLLGHESAGGFSLTRMVLLPSGWGLNLSIARYISPAGRGIHDAGLTPHVPMEPITLQELRTVRDPVLERAKAWVYAQSKE